MREVNLLAKLPRGKRNVCARVEAKTPEIVAISREYGELYFDGPRTYGYGGYRYDGRWVPVAQDIVEHFGLKSGDRILDVGCAKGFMLHDFQLLLPRLKVTGIDISTYAIDHAIETVKPCLRVGNCKSLPYADSSFDLVLAINVVHNLDLEDCKQAIREIQRVSRGRAFLVVDAWRNQREREQLESWVVTCRTHMHVEDWKRVFKECGYTGDYYWFIAE